jgi:hypothetical protein
VKKTTKKVQSKGKSAKKMPVRRAAKSTKKTAAKKKVVKKSASQKKAAPSKKEVARQNERMQFLLNNFAGPSAEEVVGYHVRGLKTWSKRTVQLLSLVRDREVAFMASRAEGKKELRSLAKDRSPFVKAMADYALAPEGSTSRLEALEKALEIAKQSAEEK